MKVIYILLVIAAIGIFVAQDEKFVIALFIAILARIAQAQYHFEHNIGEDTSLKGLFVKRKKIPPID